MKRAALTLCMILAWGSVAHALPQPTATSIGAVYPGARLSAHEQNRECGERYRFEVEAPMAQVARFYVAQGEAAGLQLTSDTSKTGADWRLLMFTEKSPPPGRTLFVTLDARGTKVIGFVYFSSHSRICA